MLRYLHHDNISFFASFLYIYFLYKNGPMMVWPLSGQDKPAFSAHFFLIFKNKGSPFYFFFVFLESRNGWKEELFSVSFDFLCTKTYSKKTFFMFLRIYSCLLKKFLWKTLFLCSEWARYSRSCYTIKSYKETAISSFLPCKRLPILTFILFINKTLVWKLFAENCICSNKWPPKK